MTTNLTTKSGTGNPIAENVSTKETASEKINIVPNTTYLTLHNHELLDNIFKNEDCYKNHMNNLKVIVEGMLGLAEQKEGTPDEEKAYGLFNTINHVYGALLTGPAPYAPYPKDENGNWLR